MATITHYCAENDYNGNPQRVYVLSNEDGNHAAWDEGYKGSHAVPGIWREQAYFAEPVKITVKQYKQFLRELPSPDYAYEVKGYSHLRSI